MDEKKNREMCEHAAKDGVSPQPAAEVTLLSLFQFIIVIKTHGLTSNSGRKNSLLADE